MTTYPNLAREFPDFDQATLPAIPAGFEDQSWGNEPSPSFSHTGLRLRLWIDYADAAQSEWPEERTQGIMKRFSVYPTDAEGAHVERLPALETDDWAEVEAFIAVTPRAPFWTLGARHEFENGQEAFVVALDAKDGRFAVVRKGEVFEAAYRDAALQDESDTWVNPIEDEGEFDTLDEAVAAMIARRASQADRLPDEAAKRVALAEETLAVFERWLKPADWAKCQRGEDDPDSFCDSNEGVAEAYQTVFGAEPDIQQPLVCARWNAAVRLASALMVDPQSDPADTLAFVEADDACGLALVGGGRNLRSVVDEFLSNKPIS